jgi:hypothetical protein
MVNPSYFVALALALACSTRLVSAEEDHESRMQRREAINSILGSLFESKMASRRAESDLRALPAFSKRHERSFSAPLAHPRAPISPSFHLLKVTGAKTNVGTDSSDSALNFKVRTDSSDSALNYRVRSDDSEFDAGGTLHSRARPDALQAAEALSKKYQYVEELRKQFEN